MRVVRRSCRRPGRLVPATARRLRSRAIRLRPGQVIDWHSTGKREELLIILAGTVHVEQEDPDPDCGRGGRGRALRLTASHCAFIPSRTRHRVLNRSRHPARYLYIAA
ncbi:MAG: cupin domain-containing protein [Candidatus Omnitrophica bacterium]|nr:cupin domain-containing protein [Candidatus Omnitrophota bacterium]